jgi:hypothetical protein
LQLTLFDTRDMASITSPDFPGERLVVCRNPDLASQRSRTREELLAATEKDLAAIRTRVGRKRDPLRGTAEIALAVGAVLNTHKMRKHFDLEITDTSFSFARKTAEITAEAATDGLYVVRTNLSEQTLGDAETVRSYKSLARLERAFRCIKTVDLHVQPVYHWLEGRVRAHVFLCMLAYYLEWHMRRSLAPMLFDDTDKEAAEALRSSVVAQAQRSKAAVKKQTTGVTPDGLPVHSFRTLLADLATLARNTIVTAINPLYPLSVVTRPTPVQQKAFDLLGLAMQPVAGPKKTIYTYISMVYVKPKKEVQARSCGQLPQPYDGCGEVYHGAVVACHLLIAGSDAAKLLELGEEALDEVAFLVEILVKWPLAGP